MIPKDKKIKALKESLVLLDMYKDYAESYIEELESSNYDVGYTKNSAGVKRISLEFSKKTNKFRKNYRYWS